MTRSVIPMMMMPTPSTPTATTNSMQESIPFEDLPSLSTSTLPLREFYVVQRCWYSGPRQDVAPVDYLRLLETPEDAQEAAFHSAMAWSGLPSHLISTVPVRNHGDDQIQTTSAYAACGTLFWVRRVWAAASVDVAVSTNQFRFSYQQQHYQHYNHGYDQEQASSAIAAAAALHPDHQSTTAFAVLTEGVIGGTGNRNSRRGVEISKGRVFCGHALAARAAALQVARQLQHDIEQCQYQLPPNIQVVAIPIGKPAEYATRRFVQEWTHPLGVAASSSVTSVALSTSSKTSSNNSISVNARPVWKRSWSDQDLVATSTSLDSLEEQQPSISTPFPNSAATPAESLTYFFPPMSKRPRRCGDVASSGADEEAMDMAVCWS